MAKLKGLAWLVTAILVGVVAAYGLPYFARHVPWSIEQRAARLLGGAGAGERVCATRPEAAALFKKIVARIYPIYPDDHTFPVTVEPVEGSTVNAFASLGGHIYVFDGLIKQAETAEELAGVLAHEIEHVRQRHIIQGVIVRLVTVEGLKLALSGGGAINPETASALLNLQFSREQEREADEGGLRRLQDARVDVAGFQHFFERAKNMSSVPAILSDHPDNDDRAQLAQRYRDHPIEPIMDKKDWELVKKICVKADNQPGRRR